MRIISWNVQGLGGSNFLRYRGRLRQEMMRCLTGGPVDVLMLQARAALGVVDGLCIGILRYFGQQLLDPLVSKGGYVCLLRILGGLPLLTEAL